MRRETGIGLLLVSALSAGCLDRFTHAERDPGAVLWASAESAPLERPDLERLRASGIGEIFVRGGTVEWSGRRPSLSRGAPVSLPPRTLVTLVVEGAWPSGKLEAQETASALAEGLRTLKIEAESRGLLPRGFHLHLLADERLPSYAEVLVALRGELDRNQFLSVTFDPAWLDDTGGADVAAAADFLIGFLYGSGGVSVGDDGRWDLEKIQEAARRLDELGRGFLVGVVTAGSLVRIDASGEALEATTSADLRGLLETAALEAKSAFLFEGFHRQVLDFEARRPLRVGEWTLRRKDRLRLNRPTAYHLAELHRRLSEAALENYLGEAYDGLPGKHENLAIGLESLLLSRLGGPLEPEMSLGVDLQAQRGDRWVVQASLRNRSVLGTSFALLDANYLELHAPDAVVERVELGQFRRLELARGRQGFGSVRGARSPDSVRLFYPLLDGGWSVASGPIYLTSSSDELKLELRASYLLPGGGTFETERSWRPGDAEEEAGETEEPAAR